MLGGDCFRVVGPNPVFGSGDYPIHSEIARCESGGWGGEREIKRYGHNVISRGQRKDKNVNTIVI